VNVLSDLTYWTVKNNVEKLEAVLAPS